MNALKLLPLALLAAVPGRALAQAAEAPMTALAPPPTLEQHPLSCTACRATEGSGLVVFAAGYGAMVYEFAAINREFYSASAGAGEVWIPPEFATVATAPMLLPVVGPLYTMALTDNPSDKRLLALDTGVQVAGLAVALAGERMEERWRVHLAALPTRGGAEMTGAVAF